MIKRKKGRTDKIGSQNSSSQQLSTNKSEQKSKAMMFSKQRQKCAVCLNDLGAEVATLSCNHKFCSVDCALGWWKFNEYCPYCRKDIIYVESMDGRKYERDNISQVESQNSENFVPRCDQCWADIHQDQQKKICITCSSRFIHRNCLVFSIRCWVCCQCLEKVDSERKQVYPLIPYNPIIHLLFPEKK